MARSNRNNPNKPWFGEGEKKPREFPKGGLGSGMAEEAAEAIRKNKKKKGEQLKELGY